jgi:hypothetical protein
MKPVITILLVLAILPNLSAQEIDSSNYKIEKSSFSANFMGSSSLFGITFDKVLSEKLIWEIGFGYVGIGTGITYYPFEINKSSFCPYFGLKVSFLVLPEVIAAYGGYIPIGVTYFSKHRINIGIDIGPALGELAEGGGPPAEYDENSSNNRIHKINVYGNLKIGFRL